MNTRPASSSSAIVSVCCCPAQEVYSGSPQMLQSQLCTLVRVIHLLGMAASELYVIKCPAVRGQSCPFFYFLKVIPAWSLVPSSLAQSYFESLFLSSGGYYVINSLSMTSLVAKWNESNLIVKTINHFTSTFFIHVCYVRVPIPMELLYLKISLLKWVN